MRYDPNPPEANLNIVNEAVALPRSQFDKANGMKWIIASYAEQTQELDQVFIDLILKFSIENGSGETLDIVGKWLDRPRQGLEDSFYKAVLRATSLVRKSDGRIESLYDILKIIDSRSYKILTIAPMYLLIEAGGAWGGLPIELILELITEAKQAGVDFDFVYSDSDDIDCLMFADSDDEGEASETQGFADDDETNGGLFAEIAGI